MSSEEHVRSCQEHVMSSQEHVTDVRSSQEHVRSSQKNRIMSGHVRTPRITSKKDLCHYLDLKLFENRRKDGPTLMDELL